MRHAGGALRLLVAGVLATGVVVALVASPVASPVTAAPGEVPRTTWDGPSIGLAWDGPSTTTDSASLSGNPGVVPGDVQGRTITVTDVGPADAVQQGRVRDGQLPGVDPQGDSIVTIAEVLAAGGSDGGSGSLAVTGVRVLRAALVAVVAIGIGSILAGAARRRRGAEAGSYPAPSAG